jgi:hypothetical protein
MKNLERRSIVKGQTLTHNRLNTRNQMTPCKRLGRKMILLELSKEELVLFG